MKKILLLGLSLVGIASLASCDFDKEEKAAIVYTNEDGEEVSYEFEKTDDAKKVEEAIDIISKVESDTSHTGVKISGSVSLLIDGTYNEEKIGMDLTGKLDIAANNPNLQLTVDSILSTDIYASLESSQKMTQGETTETNSMKASAYLDNKVAYVDYTEGESASTKLKLNLPILLEGYQDEIDEIESILGGGEGIGDILGETSLSDLVEQYKVTISSTAKDNVTFKVSYPLSDIDEEYKDLSLDVYIGWDLKVNSFKSISIKDSIVFKTIMENETGGEYTKCNLELGFEFEYGNYTVDKLTEIEKLTYIDYLMSMFPGSN